MLVYTNAADVLPPDLLTEVQKHWNGYLYVSPVKKEKKLTEEEKSVLLSIQSGCAAQDVAVAHGISIWRVYRLARKLGKVNPYAKKANSRANVAPENVTEANDGTFRQSPSDAQKAP